MKSQPLRQMVMPHEGMMEPAEGDGLSYIMIKIREALKAKGMSLSDLPHITKGLNSILAEIVEDTLSVSELRKKGTWLMSWAFVQIRYICGHSGSSLTKTRLTSGEQAWIWALAEFSHNIPRVENPFEDFPPPLSLSTHWVDDLERLHKLYKEHQSNIIKYRARGWTKRKICLAILSNDCRSND